MVLLAAAATRAAEPPIRTLSEQEVWDLLAGSAITATRGRVQPIAPYIEGTVRSLLAQGKPFRLVSLIDVPDEWTIAEAGGRIGGGAWKHVGERMKSRHVPVVPSAEGMVLALDALSRHTGRKFNAVVRSESAEAVIGTFQAAIAAGLPVVDACPTGRAVPELAQSIPYTAGIPAAPAALVTLWGDVVLVEKAVDDARLEDLGRSIAVGSGGTVITASTVMSGRDAKRALIAGSISREILLGRTVREARERGADPVAALLAFTDGLWLFRGKVASAEPREERGFNWWDVHLQGAGQFAGHDYRVWVQNENIVAWLDGKPDAMSPDLIVPLNPQTGEAIASSTLGGYTIGAEVVVVGFPASPLWRVPKGIEVLGPRHFGFDFDYVPIEILHARDHGKRAVSRRPERR
jgi:hypothetical protein